MKIPCYVVICLVFVAQIVYMSAKLIAIQKNLATLKERCQEIQEDKISRFLRGQCLYPILIFFPINMVAYLIIFGCATYGGLIDSDANLEKIIPDEILLASLIFGCVVFVGLVVYQIVYRRRYRKLVDYRVQGTVRDIYRANKVYALSLLFTFTFCAAWLAISLCMVLYGGFCLTGGNAFAFC